MLASFPPPTWPSPAAAPPSARPSWTSSACRSAATELSARTFLVRVVQMLTKLAARHTGWGQWAGFIQTCITPRLPGGSAERKIAKAQIPSGLSCQSLGHDPSYTDLFNHVSGLSTDGP
jgi:hypothetical protein